MHSLLRGRRLLTTRGSWRHAHARTMTSSSQSHQPVRRLNSLLGHLDRDAHDTALLADVSPLHAHQRLRLVHTSAAATATAAASATATAGAGKQTGVWIGSTHIDVGEPTHAELVPVGVPPLGSGFRGEDGNLQEVLHHLRWMMQKDRLGQDMFLIGPPGPYRRWLAFRYCELTHREIEYIALSRDTTESDLKQRRELLDGTVFYHSQCAVKAAEAGRVLVLDGLEKCERNVLPVLNNLLENREMALEDGRFLVAAERYDALGATKTRAELDALKMVRVHPAFRVIALGLPVPRYQGNPLDPPLRSRFQARHIPALSLDAQLHLYNVWAPDVPANVARKLLSFVEALNTMERGGQEMFARLPHFPDVGVRHMLALQKRFPGTALNASLRRVYPVDLFVEKGDRSAIEGTLNRLHIAGPDGNTDDEFLYEFAGGADVATDGSQSSTISLAFIPKSAGDDIPVAHTQQSVVAPYGPALLAAGDVPDKLVPTKFTSRLLSAMLEDHASGRDMCIVGEQGVGKSVIVSAFARQLGYTPADTMYLYKDMTARDLLQCRSTSDNGDTKWENSPLVRAASQGGLAVLDGVHRLNVGTLSVLQSLVHDRELSLYNGTRLVRWDRYDDMKTRLGFDDAAMRERGLLRVHPSFRIIAVGSVPTLKKMWLTSETIAMFSFHVMVGMAAEEKIELLRQVFPTIGAALIGTLVAFDTKLRAWRKKHPEGKSVAPLSMRQSIRVCQHLLKFPGELYEAVQRNMLLRFMPIEVNEEIDHVFEKAGVAKPEPVSSEAALAAAAALTAEVVDDTVNARSSVYTGKMLRIGDVTRSIRVPRNPELIPHTLFYNVPKHVEMLRHMLIDMNEGNDLLLIGNQGVGKNKLIDHLLEILQLEREYIQLHRDTTVQTLTLYPSLLDGKVVWEDSPLVKAVKYGRMLVVDEADKAPLEVVCILKGLVQDGEMLLADGRRIVALDHAASSLHSVNVAHANDRLNDGTKRGEIIPLHPNFRMVVLANRPGFPFLGNDFFAECGDCFSCHTIDNPDEASELMMLRKYGPDVPELVLRKLIALFGDLRDLVDQGLLTYPYSTRELVAIVKHLQLYRDEGLTTTMQNVFSFDTYDSQLKEHLAEIFHRHGVPYEGDDNFKSDLGVEFGLPAPELTHTINVPAGAVEPLLGAVEADELVKKGAWPVERPRLRELKGRTEGRISSFTEEKYRWNVETTGRPLSTATFDDGTVHILMGAPLELHSYTPDLAKYSVLDLQGHLPFYNLAPPYPCIVPLGHCHPLLDAAVAESGSDVCKVLCVYIPMYNTLFLVDVERSIVAPVKYPTMDGTMGRMAVFGSKAFSEAVPRGVIGRSTHPVLDVDMKMQMCEYDSVTPVLRIPRVVDTLAKSDGIVVLFKPFASSVVVMDFAAFRSFRVHIPEQVFARRVFLLSKYDWIVEAEDGALFKGAVDYQAGRSEFRPLRTDIVKADGDIVPFLPAYMLTGGGAPPTPQMMLNAHGAFVQLGFPTGNIDGAYRMPAETKVATHLRDPKQDGFPVFSLYLARSNQVLNLVRMPHLKPTKTYGVDKEMFERKKLADKIVDVAENALRITARDGRIIPNEQAEGEMYFEVIDLASQQIRRFRPPGDIAESANAAFSLMHTERLKNRPANYVWRGQIVSVAEMTNGDVVMVQKNGVVRVLEVDAKRIAESFNKWKEIIGGKKPEELSVSVEYDGTPPPPTGPKEGIDDGKEHHGGNTFKGGSGGSDTAGQGGAGGAYRSKSKHPIHQVKQIHKDNVPEHIKKEAKEMALAALQKRLDEIQMNPFDSNVYEKYMAAVSREISQLRVILAGVEAKSKERTWLKLKTTGDLDETRLVDGIAGEHTVYKKRGEKPPTPGAFQQKPKRIRFVVDVSGSMYRFDFQDRRLERLMQTTLMLMEGLRDFEHKYRYDVYGHSGERPDIKFVDADKPPGNRKERYKVLKEMQAHSEYCPSGDNTVEGVEAAVKAIAAEDADEHFVFLISDANLDRYGITPRQLANAMRKNDKVQVYVIFIASIQGEAERLKKTLPKGRVHVCLDTAKLPVVIKQIFQHSAVESN